MATTYGTKYTQTIFVPIYNKSTNTYTNYTYVINAKKKNYSGLTTTINYYDKSAIILKYDSSDKTSFDLPIHGSSLDWNVYVDQTSTGLTEIAESNYKDWQIELSGSSGQYWIGWFQPDNYSQSFLLPYNYYMTLNATDGLAYLKNIDYSGHTTGATTVIQAVKYGLDQIGLNLPIVDQCNLTEHLLSGATTPTLANIYLHLGRFKSSGNGQTTYNNMYDALSYALEPFNAMLTQHKGTWLIQQKNEVNTPRHTYNSTVTSATTVNYNRAVDISNNYFYTGTDELSKIIPDLKFSTTFQNGQLSTRTNIISVALGTTFHNGTSTAAWDTFGSGGTTANGTASNPSVTKQFTTTFAISNTATGGTLQLVTRVSASVSFISGSAYPFFKFQLKYPNATVVDDPSGQRLTHSSGDTFTSGNFTINQAGVYTVIYNIIPNSPANYLSWSYFFNNFAANLSAGSKATHDQLITTKNLYQSPITNVQNTIYFSDSVNQNDKGALLAYNKTSGLTNTSLWSSYKASIAKKQFDNFDFLSNTFQFKQMNNPALGTGLTWTYDKLSGWATAANGGSGYYYTKVLYQTGFTSGLYSITFSVQNESTVTGGVNPNISFGIWMTSGGSYQRLNTQVYSLTSQVGFFNKIFIFNVPDDNAIIGFDMYRFGPGTDVKVWVNGATINSYQASDYNQPHYYLYNYSKLKKRYRFTDYVTVSTYPTQNLYFNSIIVINGTQYEITGFTYDIVNNKVDLQLAEFTDSGLLPINVANTISSLTSIDGGN